MELERTSTVACRYLFNLTDSMCFSSCTSQIQHIMIGVPQGSIYGPLLFVIFHNIAVIIKPLIKIKYANDTAMLLGRISKKSMSN